MNAKLHAENKHRESPSKFRGQAAAAEIIIFSSKLHFPSMKLNDYKMSRSKFQNQIDGRRVSAWLFFN